MEVVAAQQPLLLRLGQWGFETVYVQRVGVWFDGDRRAMTKARASETSMTAIWPTARKRPTSLWKVVELQCGEEADDIFRDCSHVQGPARRGSRQLSIRILPSACLHAARLQIALTFLPLKMTPPAMRGRCESHATCFRASTAARTVSPLVPWPLYHSRPALSSGRTRRTPNC